MKNLKISIVVVSLLFVTALAKAQSTPLIQLKFGVPTVATDPKIDDFSGTFGWGIGFGWERALSDNFYFQPGLTYTSKTLKQKYDFTDPATGTSYGNETTINPGSLDVPLNFFYKTGAPGDNTRFLVGFGPSLGFRMGGKQKGNYHAYDPTTGNYTNVSFDDKISYGSSATEDDMKSFIFGFGAQLGLEFGGRFQACAEWSTDLNNAVPYDNVKWTTGMFGLRLGIMLNQNAY